MYVRPSVSVTSARRFATQGTDATKGHIARLLRSLTHSLARPFMHEAARRRAHGVVRVYLHAGAALRLDDLGLVAHLAHHAREAPAHAAELAALALGWAVCDA